MIQVNVNNKSNTIDYYKRSGIDPISVVTGDSVTVGMLHDIEKLPENPVVEMLFRVEDLNKSCAGCFYKLKDMDTNHNYAVTALSMLEIVKAVQSGYFNLAGDGGILGVFTMYKEGSYYTLIPYYYEQFKEGCKSYKHEYNYIL